MGFSMNVISTLRSTVIVLALALVAVIATEARAATEDVIHMSDGRVLHGQIISETNQSIVFDYLNQDLGISVTMTLPKAAILKVDRDVQVADPDEEPAAEPGSAPEDDAGGKPESNITSRSRVSQNTNDAAEFYIVEMSGQVGTDIRSSVYEDVLEEIKSTHPDVVIIKLDSKMLGDSMLSYWVGGEVDADTYEQDPYRRMETLMSVMDDELELVKSFHHELPKDIRQVVWVHDATGPASLLALAWPDMYMTPDADLGSMGEIWSMTQFPDEDVRSKMEKAWFGTAKGIMQFGNHSDNFMEGMLRPKSPFSFSCRGREPVWYNSFEGDLPIFASDTGYQEEIRNWISGGGRIDHGLEFSSRICEDFLISDGTAETIEDLALLMDERQYQVVETKVLEEAAEYKEDWRERFDRTLNSFKDFRKYMGRAEGDYPLENLQKAKKELARVIGGVRVNESVAIRFKSMTGLDQIQLEIIMEQLKSQIRQLTRGGGGGGGGGRGGVGGGPRP